MLFRPVCWQWERDRLESLLLGLGLRLDRKDEGWTRFRFPADGTRCSLLCSGEKVVRLEVFIDVNEELGDLRVYHPSRYIEVRDKVFQEFEEKFERAVGHAEAVLGPPWFRGSWRDAACPDRLVSPIRIAAWSVSGGQLMVEYQHEDNELPLIISVVVQRSPHGDGT